MKLVEILAREMAEWPAEVYALYQWRDGEITGKCFSGGIMPLASDFESAHVTSHQWQAERDRIMGMEKKENVWQQAVDTQLVNSHLGVAGDVDQMKADAALVELIDWHISVATDPATNGGFLLSKEHEYEQKLWDRVAVAAFAAHLPKCYSVRGEINEAQNLAFDYAKDDADAFMVERAKRVGK